MKILITSNNVEGRGGTESFVRTLARGLESVGHSVMAYSSDPGQGERLLENDVVPVATDLENLPFLPDVIHAQHHLDTMTALTALPGVPAVHHSTTRSGEVVWCNIRASTGIWPCREPSRSASK